jgi:predicted TPR repeat methyltransferase
MSEPDSARITSLLHEAIGLHRGGKLPAAQARYLRVLELAPRNCEALHLLGVIARQEGQAQRAADLISEALAIDPEHATAHCNLGAALQDLGRSAQALASYDRALRFKPDYAVALGNRGNALRTLGRLEEALSSYDRALAQRPVYPEVSLHRAIVLGDLGRAEESLASADHAIKHRADYPQAWCARGNALQSLGRIADAVQSYDRALALEGGNAKAWCWRGTALKKVRDFERALDSYDRAIELKADYATAWHYRANTLRSMGRRQDAIDAYQRALSLGADATQVAFALAALGVGATPEGSPSDYVRELFDQYAGHFDQHLVQGLDYRTPALLEAAIRRCGPVEQADILDLGCGTGLCAEHLRPWARTLTGVDLSDKMLDKARARGLYDRLACADIGAFLAQEDTQFDLVVAADVFVYFGDLEPVFGQVWRALRPGGRFCFSVEACDERQDFALTESNRFAHSLAYLRRLAGVAGFQLAEANRAPLRTEHGAEVMGYLAVLRRP